MMKKILISLLSFALMFGAFSAQADDDYEYDEGELAQILAPIALYPDSVLTHILIASTYPLEVIEANRWLSKSKNRRLSPAKALDKVENKPWDPSVKALIPFPKVIERLSDNLSWTQQLGDAFLQDEEEVLDTIQILRKQADKVGNLEKMDNVKIVREKRIIVLEPREPEVVYIPYYDTRYVYGSWRWAHRPPIYWHNRYYDYHGSPFYWYPRVHISFNYFHSAFHWRNRHVVRFHHRYDYDTPRHYFRRHELIRHSNVSRWEHNPVHRRGVAYRSHETKQRFNSHRPSRVETQRIRNTERKHLMSQRSSRDSQRAVNNSARINSNSKVNSGIKTRNTSKIHRADPVVTGQAKTRHQRIKRSLNERDVDNRRDLNSKFNHNRSYQKDVVRSTPNKRSDRVYSQTQSNRIKNNSLKSSQVKNKRRLDESRDRFDRAERSSVRNTEPRVKPYDRKPAVKRAPAVRQERTIQRTREVQRPAPQQQRRMERPRSRDNFERPARQNFERRSSRNQNRSSRRVEH